MSKASSRRSIRRSPVALPRGRSRPAEIAAEPLDALCFIVYIHDMNENASLASTARMLLDNCLCHKTRMAARSVTRAYDEALRSTGLRATQIAVLAAVGAHGALSIRSLAQSVGMDRTTLTRNLQPLERRGLVALAPEARYRSRMLTLTEEGQRLLMEALPLWKEQQQVWRERLGQQGWAAAQHAVSSLAGATVQASA
jgi:DNA-binding MarR family transcriptional regulator